jgi:hypothetical protein
MFFLNIHLEENNTYLSILNRHSERSEESLYLENKYEESQKINSIRDPSTPLFDEEVSG